MKKLKNKQMKMNTNMKNIYLKKCVFTLASMLIMMISVTLMAQESVIDMNDISREEVLELSYDQLLNMPLEDLMKLADIVGVSMEELLQLAMNKNVSTASKKMETVFESPLSTSVISSEEIRLSGATTVAEALRLVPGLIVREESNGNYDIHIRGFDNVPPENFTHFSENMISLIMVDGIPVYNNVAGGTFWETLPVGINQIDRIDVVRGPSSALYGPNAVSGVINIVTKKQGDDNFDLDFSQRVGAYNSIVGDLYASGRITDDLRISVGGRYDIRNRMTDKQYEFFSGQYRTFEEQETGIVNITAIDTFEGPFFQSLPQERSKEVFAGNINLIYSPAYDVNITATGSMQSSSVNQIFFENIATPYSVRSSNTGFGSINANVKGLSAYFAFQGGTQDLSEGMVRPVIEYDMQSLNSNVEYLIDLGKLALLPAVNYQSASYDDKIYIQDMRESKNDQNIDGLFGGKKTTSLFGGSLRADYRPIENLRLIAAGRVDKYDYIEEYYPSYQFVASYNLNDKHLFRALFSKANRGAFVGDLHANFRNPIIEGLVVGAIPADSYNMFLMDPQLAPFAPLLPTDPPPIHYNFTQYYLGSNNTDRELKLMSMNMFEIGYRGKISNQFQIEIEGFISNAKDFDALVSYTHVDTGYYSIGELTGLPDYNSIGTPLPDTLYSEDPLYYENLPLTATQTGVSATISLSLANNILIKAFGTYQVTNISNHLTVLGDTVDMEHKNTPSFYGGLTAIYIPTDKIELFLGSYFYGAQTYNRYYRPLAPTPEAIAAAKANAEDKISSKLILSARASYKVWNESRIFVEGKNLLFDNSPEAGFGDEIKTMFFAGIQLGF